eukprot:6188419-Pleurochrysis_carterae.AAC.1
MLQPQSSAERPVAAHGTGQGILKCPESVPAQAATSVHRHNFVKRVKWSMDKSKNRLTTGTQSLLDWWSGSSDRAITAGTPLLARQPRQVCALSAAHRAALKSRESIKTIVTPHTEKNFTKAQIDCRRAHIHCAVHDAR